MESFDSTADDARALFDGASDIERADSDASGGFNSGVSRNIPRSILPDVYTGHFPELASLSAGVRLHSACREHFSVEVLQRWICIRISLYYPFFWTLVSFRIRLLLLHQSLGSQSDADAASSDAAAHKG